MSNSRRRLRKTRKRVHRSRRSVVEALETRQLLAALTVNSLADNTTAGDNLVTLREAIIAAQTDGTTDLGQSGSGADTINFASGTGQAFENGGVIRLASQLDINDAGGLTIEGSTASGEVIITGDAGNDDAKVGMTEITDAVSNTMTSDNVRVFNITGGTANLNQLTVTGGVASGTDATNDGGGILVGSGAILNFNGGKIIGNRTIGDDAFGGAINNFGTTTVNNSAISGNRAGSGGGGINNSTYDTLTLVNSTVTGNSAEGILAFQGNGGGVSNYGTATITDSTISGNSANNDGGGIINSVSDTLVIDNSTISGNIANGNNSASGDGGGLHNRGTATLLSTTLSNNTASTYGGGINNSTDNTAVLTNVTFVGNTAARGGAFSNFGTATLTNNTLTGNNGTIEGGGVFTSSGKATSLRNSIVLGNNAPAGAETSGAAVTSMNSITSGSATDTFATTQLVGGVQAGVLADNGGTVQTVSLKSAATNLALDAGSASHLVESNTDLNGDGDTNDTITTDARGLGRSVDLSAVGSSEIIDLGAFERQTEMPSLIVTTNSDDVDNTDLVTSLREAINLANSQSGADAITFATALANQTITLGGTQLTITDDLSIDASALTGNVTIDADQGSRVLKFSSSTGNLSLHAMTITGGRTTGGSESGGGIQFNSSGTLTLISSSVSGNTTTGGGSRGGGIFSYTGSVTLTDDSAIIGNEVDSNEDGGGIFTASGDVTVTNSVIQGNSSQAGGGLAAVNGDVIVTRSSISGNSASIGGGIYSGAGTVSLMASTVNGNTATDSGGGISNNEGTLTLTNTTISGNTVDASSNDGRGGGISAVGIVTLNNSTITGNSSDNEGGGVWIGNTSSNPTLAIHNSIVAGNTAAGNGVDLLPDPDSTLDVDFSVIGVATGLSFTGTNNQTGTTANPLDPMLGPLANNGGTTLTHALQTGSPAIDISNFLPNSLSTDATGNARVVDISGVDNGGFLDAGAVEVQGGTPVGVDAPSLVVTILEDTLNSFDGETSLREAIFYVENGVGGGDTITFASATGQAFATGGIIRLTRGTSIELARNLTIDGSVPVGVVSISGDVAGNDNLVQGTSHTDVDNNSANESDNIRVFNVTAGTANLKNLTITGGVVTGSNDGGGVLVNSGATVNFTNSTVAGNKARFGAGVNNRGTTTITGSTISGNRAASGGGGVSNSTNDMLTVTNSTISGNISGTNGGGIVNYGTATLSSVTVSQNHANAGGGISTASGRTTTLNHTIVANNSIPGIGGFAELGGTGTFDGNDNLIANGQNFFTQLGNNTVFDDPVLGPLQNNGGSTRTHALQIGSPAINAGDPNFDPNTFTPALVNDQRGTGFARVVGGQVDIGAFEAKPPALVSFTRQQPVDETTSADVLTFRATFDEQVQNVDASDFTVNGSTTAGITDVSPVQGTGEAVFAITVSGGDLAGFNGIVGVDLAPGQSITNLPSHELLPGEPPVDETYTVDNAGPQVEDVLKDGGTSIVRTVTVLFDSTVVIDPGAFELKSADSTPVPVSHIAVTLGGKTQATLTFSGPLVDTSGSLMDGNYQLTILDTKIRDAADNSMDGDGNGSAGGAHVDDFYRLFGDTNANRTVDLLDFAQFRQSFGKSATDPGYNEAFDSNANDTIDLLDFAAFRQSFGKTI